MFEEFHLYYETPPAERPFENLSQISLDFLLNAAAFRQFSDFLYSLFSSLFNISVNSFEWFVNPEHTLQILD